ncbi:MAG: 23S rRNA (uracil(1939)-C(5))-methyltransferase RlmD [Bacteriovorax sp.]|nr:23S rRNA (uracil(1939)-C(5))-methyltransferase RlmD [Bacteriovorax sp.]
MKCTYFLQSHCRSCNLLDKSYTNTLLLKESELKKLFPQNNILFKPTVGLEHDATGSRSKAKFAVFSKDNELTFGFYHSDGTPRELEVCPLHAVGINSLLSGIRDILKKYKIIPYDLKTKTGELKYLLLSKSGESDSAEFLLRFVLRSKESLDRLKQSTADMQAMSSKIKVITANIQPIHQAIIEGDEEIVLSFESAIIHQFDEFKLALGARSFFQVTPQIAQLLYSAVADSVAIDLPSSLIDLYCGVGAFSFYASRHCPDVTGVEISKEAIDCAKRSVLTNKSKIDFYAMDVEEYLKKFPKKFEAVLVNPPRRGLNSCIIKMIESIAPQFIYYSSCNASSLARDFSELEPNYQIQSLQIFDMFPYTAHYETLMCLIRK